MRLVHNIGDTQHSNYNTRSEILACDEPLGFDGVYLNVYENQDTLEDKTGVFFVMGNYMGKDNEFDLMHAPNLEEYCTWKQINEMVDKYDFDIGWHTYSHPDLTTLTKEEIMLEITPPFPMKYFAYPYGKYNKLVIECVEEAGYEKAWSVTQGDEEPYTLRRDYI